MTRELRNDPYCRQTNWSFIQSGMRPHIDTGPAAATRRRHTSADRSAPPAGDRLYEKHRQQPGNKEYRSTDGSLGRPTRYNYTPIKRSHAVWQAGARALSINIGELCARASGSPRACPRSPEGGGHARSCRKETSAQAPICQARRTGTRTADICKQTVLPEAHLSRAC